MSAAPDVPVLELVGLSKRFGPVLAVDNISFAVQPGEVFTLLGPSGCGKSTTLRLVAGLEQPDQGSLQLRGRTIASATERFFLPPERRNMGMVFQSYAIWPHMTVFENVAFPLQLRRWPKQKIREAVGQTLATVGLEGLEQRPATMLSGGQQQRVALARALVYNPDILLLDEPLSNLDAKLREHMRVELRTLQRRLGIAVLFVTHDQSEAMALSDRVAVMNAGHIEQLGTPDEVYERPTTTFVRDFLGRAITLECVVRRDGGRCWLEMAAAGSSTFSFDGGKLDEYAGGGTVYLSCRPEDLQLLPADAGGANTFRAIVEEVLYLGERVEYRVRAGGSASFLISGPRRERYTIGAELDLLLDTSGVTLWAGRNEPVEELGAA
ncbi:MAG TPA: ABC transporter ATP-binding protein [Chloroflexota bacterium]|jgi:ABC-type Fe3+/spermidine/putrescine transport system ATPase subunit|nr:ABC transporter ATP-binding protein [Chloroflexota bacterium]